MVLDIKTVQFSDSDLKKIRNNKKSQFREEVQTPEDIKEFYTQGAGKWSGCKTGTYSELAYDSNLDFINGKYVASFLVARDMGWNQLICPYNVGTILRVQEPWTQAVNPKTGKKEILSKSEVEEDQQKMICWNDAKTFPLEESNLILEIKTIGLKRITSISVDDAISEGYYSSFLEPNLRKENGKSLKGFKRNIFQHFKLHYENDPFRNYTWDLNPFTWVLTFDKM